MYPSYLQRVRADSQQRVYQDDKVLRVQKVWGISNFFVLESVSFHANKIAEVRSTEAPEIDRILGNLVIIATGNGPRDTIVL